MKQTPEQNYVGTWDELAQRLGVSRRAIQEWRYEKQCPRDRADGRKNVAEWQEFMAANKLKRAHLFVSDGDQDEEEGEGVIRPPRVGGKAADWAKAETWKKFQKREIEVDKLMGTLLEAADLEVPLGAMLATIQTKLSQFPDRVARYIVGLRDVGEVSDRLRDEIDADLTEINAARYTAEEALAAAVAAVPFDAETERLLGLVTFEGQDRTALLQLITAVAGEALRQLGGKAIANASREEKEEMAAADTADAAEVRKEQSQIGDLKSEKKGKGRKAKAVPAAPPANIEGAICEGSRRKSRRKRK